jgi:hypothetical protein
LPREREAELKARLDAGPRPEDGVCTLARQGCGPNPRAGVWRQLQPGRRVRSVGTAELFLRGPAAAT